jgi:mannosyl-3-phosphoglycerate phosphatase
VSVPRRLFASDVDGCLIDESTQEWSTARDALEAIRGEKALLVLCSSKTRAEIEPLVADIGLRCPFVVENGGALVIPEGSLPGRVPGAVRVEGAEVLVYGVAREVLVRELHGIAARTGAELRGFSDLAPWELERLTGLGLQAARRAQDRSYDEPFLLAPGSRARLSDIARAAQRRGLRVSQGGRFLHLTGLADKGYALGRLLGLYSFYSVTPRTVGLGDAENDIGLLQNVERPILVPRFRGGPDPVLRVHFPGAEVAPEAGPRGWNRAVLTVLQGGALPTLGALEGQRA